MLLVAFTGSLTRFSEAHAQCTGEIRSGASKLGVKLLHQGYAHARSLWTLSVDNSRVHSVCNSNTSPGHVLLSPVGLGDAERMGEGRLRY